MSVPLPIPAAAPQPLWYKDAVIYQLHVKTFADSNGDGIGDFKGLSSKLDYLSDLGVTCLWLLPMYPSPFRDDGYDIADYYSIHPSYGTLDDFREFLDTAHARHLRDDLPPCTLTVRGGRIDETGVTVRPALGAVGTLLSAYDPPPRSLL